MESVLTFRLHCTERLPIDVTAPFHSLPDSTQLFLARSAQAFFGSKKSELADDGSGPGLNPYGVYCPQ